MSFSRHILSKLSYESPRILRPSEPLIFVKLIANSLKSNLTSYTCYCMNSPLDRYPWLHRSRYRVFNSLNPKQPLPSRSTAVKMSVMFCSFSA